ncbi:MAG: hypothetical protein JSR36_08485 [Proteobacteria bacterium]|nr:hypothetical protein [Pseudomonadota bacterium]
MTNNELLALLARARQVMDRYIFDDAQVMRDDVAQLCMALDEVMPSDDRITIKAPSLLERAEEAAA